MTYKIINKNALDALKEMPNESIDCVITSPPYYGLRSYKGADTIWGGDPNCEHEWIAYTDYKDNLRFRDPNGIANVGNNKNKEIYSDPSLTNTFCQKCGAWKGQLGLEPTFQMYIEHLMMITKEIKRVLKKTGTVFWNMGDSYSSKGGLSKPEKLLNAKVGNTKTGEQKGIRYIKGIENNISEKSLMMIPERFAMAMIDDGWILRNKIIWHKTNGMPSSVKDRFSNKWEYVFFFTKNRKYYFDLDAVRKPLAVASGEEYPNTSIKKIFNNIHQKYEQNHATKHDIAVDRHGTYSDPLHTKPINPLGANPGDVLEIPYHPKGDPTIHGQRLPPQPGQKGAFNLKGANPGDVFESKYIFDKEVKTASPAGRVMRNLVDGKTTTLVREAITNVNQYLKDKLKESGMTIKELAEISGEPETQIAHYFRTDESGRALPDREFWDKVKDVLGLEEYDKYVKEEYKSVMLQFNSLGANPGDMIETPAIRYKSWYSEKPPSHERLYDPNADGGDFLSIVTVPHKESHFAIFPETLIAPFIKAGCPKGGIVIDPFAGSGTTGVVAEILGRNSILIEISPEYIKIIEDRMKTENIDKVRQMLIKKKVMKNE